MGIDPMGEMMRFKMFHWPNSALRLPYIRGRQRQVPNPSIDPKPSTLNRTPFHLRSQPEGLNPRMQSSFLFGTYLNQWVLAFFFARVFDMRALSFQRGPIG